MSENEIRLEAARADLRKARARFNDRVNDVYKSGQSIGLLELIFSTRSIGDLVSMINSMEEITEYDGELLAEIERAQREIKKAEEEISARKKSQETVTDSLYSKRREIESYLDDRRGDLAEVNADITEQERLAQEAEEQRLAAAQAERERLARSRRTVTSTSGRSSRSTSSGSPSSAAPAPAPDGSKAAQVVSIAYAQLGKPYVWAADGPDSFDCSGLTMYCYAQVGIYLPHSAAAQYNLGTRVSKDELQPGDLIFGAHGGYVSHVGIYIGGGQYIHAPQTGDVVKISNLASRSNYCGAVRLL